MEENGWSSNIEEEEEGGESEIRERKCRNGVSTILSLLGYPGDQQLDPWMIRALKKNTIQETDEKSSSCWSNYLKPNNKKNKSNTRFTKMNKINNVRLRYSKNPQLPQDLASKINELGGWNVGFVVEKRLLSSDVSCGQGRFAFSVNQVVNEFLSDEEKTSLSSCSSSSNEKDIEVKLIDPGAQERSVKLTKVEH